MSNPQVPGQPYNPSTQIDAYWQPDFTEDRYRADAERGVQYNRTIGMTPNFNTFVIPGTLADFPLLQIGTTGTLVIADGLGNVRLFMNETIHELAEGEVIGDGQGVRVVIKDRRYILNRGAMVGQWNTPDRGVEFDAGGIAVFGTLNNLKRPKTLRELAEMCFQAMGLTAFADYNIEQLKYTTQADVDAAIADGVQVKDTQTGQMRDPVIGDDIQAYPAVNWEMEPPGRELERLLEEHGFGISLWGNYGSLGGRLVVVKIGRFHPSQSSGYVPPANYAFESTERRLTSTNLPDNTIVVGGRIVVEDVIDVVTTRLGLQMGLEPVGIDVDGQVKPLGELSYAISVENDPEHPENDNPYGAFGLNPSNLKNAWVDTDDGERKKNVRVPPTINPGDGGPPIVFTLEDVQRAAHASVWKWYQIPKGDFWKLPLLSEIVRTKKLGLEIRRREPVVELERYGISDQKVRENFDAGEQEDGYTIDYEHGIVKFKEPMTRSVNTSTYAGVLGGYGPAHVKLTYGYNSVSPIQDAQHPDDKTKWKPQITLSDFYHYPIAEQSYYLCRNYGGGDEYFEGPLPTISASLAEVLKRPELILFFQYSPRTNSGQELNRSDLDAFAKKLLSQHRYTNDPYVEAPEGTIPITVTNISNDGFFRQLTWEARSGDGAITTIVANREKRGGKSGVQEYRERLFQNRLLRKLIKDDTEHNAHVFSSPSFRFTGATPSVIESESPQESAERPFARTVINANLSPGGNQAPTTIPAMSFIEFVDADPQFKVYRARTPKTPISNLSLFMVTTSDIAPGGSGQADWLGDVVVRIDSTVEVGDFVSPGNSAGQDPHVGYKGTHFRCIARYQQTGTSQWIGVITMPTVSKAFRGVVAGITNKELGRKELLVQEMYSQPFGYGGTPIKVDGWIESPIVCGQQIISLPCDRIDGDPVGNPPFFAIPIFAVDQSQLDLPHSSCTTRVVTPCLPLITQSPCMML